MAEDHAHSKQFVGKTKLDVHVTGAIRHDTDERFLMCSTHENRCDSNLMIECLRQILILSDIPLGTVSWFLQLDNSAKDNKNQYILNWCAYLVAMGLVDEIELGFLLVGHTHEDIDQVNIVSLSVVHTVCHSNIIAVF